MRRERVGDDARVHEVEVHVARYLGWIPEAKVAVGNGGRIDLAHGPAVVQKSRRGLKR